MKNSLITGLLALTLLGFSVAIIDWQLFRSAQTRTTNHAAQALKQTENMLDDARQATEDARVLLTSRCTPDTQQTLNELAAFLPHVRSVSLLRGEWIWCSSLLGAKTELVPYSALPRTSLMFYTDNRSPRQVSRLVYLASFPTGHVVVTLRDVYLRDSLEVPPGESPLYLQVGEQKYSWNGSLSAVGPGLTQLASARYDFGVSFEPPARFSLQRLWEQGWLLLLFSLLWSFGAALLLWRYLNKFTSPEETLKNAISQGEIVPYYQPVVNGITGEIHGYEVLARWKHPVSGFIPPDVFIPVAEKSGLILPLTHHLMMSTMRDMQTIMADVPEGLHISFNISAAHIHSPGLLDDCRTFIAAFGAKRVTLILEITEREPLELTTESRKALADLRENGVALALDDFGTGYSGLAYLNEFSVDYIKIDRNFVGRITEDPESTRLVDCVIDMAKALSLRIVAEGVETAQQLDHMNQQHITLLQGYYFWAPLPFEKLTEVLLRPGIRTAGRA